MIVYKPVVEDEDQTHKLLQRLGLTPGSSFQPVITETTELAQKTWEAINNTFTAVLVSSVTSFLDLAEEKIPAQVIVICIDGPLQDWELTACNRRRDDFASLGLPVVWIMSHDQRMQLVYCPDLWSCRDVELVLKSKV